jgi:tyrosine-protein kinase Src
MGNKCCSKRQDQDLVLVYPGYGKKDSSFPSNMTGSKQTNNGSLDSRYTPDPHNRGQLKPVKGGVDFIRPRTTPCEYI